MTSDLPVASDTDTMVDTIEAHYRVQMQKLQQLKANLPQLRQRLREAEAACPGSEAVRHLKKEIAATEQADVEYLLTVGPLLASYDPKNKATKGQQFREYIELTQDAEAKKRMCAREIEAACISLKHKKIKGHGNQQCSLADAVCTECGGRKVMCHSEASCVCTECGLSSPYFDDTDAGLPYGQIPNRPQSAYRRVNHLVELLSQVQVWAYHGVSLACPLCRVGISGCASVAYTLTTMYRQQFTAICRVWRSLLSPQAWWRQ